MCEVVLHIINAHVPRPAPANRRRTWVRAGEQLRFASGLRMAVQSHIAVGGRRDLVLRWHHGAHSVAALTCYEPVSLIDDCGLRVVVRAVAMQGEAPIALLMEVEGVSQPPLFAIEVAA